MRFSYRALFLSQWEDSLLAVGGIVAALPAGFADTSSLTVIALVVAGAGKAIPSLFGQFYACPSGPFPIASPPTLRHPAPGERDWWAITGDLILLVGTLMAFLVYEVGGDLTVFLVGIGLGFFVKAMVSLGELWDLSGVLDDPTSPAAPEETGPTRASLLGSATTENVLLGALGASALGLAVFTGATSTAEAALGLAALGKAVPSFLAAAIGSTSS